MDALGVESRVAAIAELGLSLSLDDFGTGYSSLSHLRRLPVTELKIDRSFVLEVHDSDAIVRAIVQLAHNLGPTTGAEGVETADDWHVLRAIGCDVAQGDLFSRPLPAAQPFGQSGPPGDTAHAPHRSLPVRARWEGCVARGGSPQWEPRHDKERAWPRATSST